MNKPSEKEKPTKKEDTQSPPELLVEKSENLPTCSCCPQEDIDNISCSIHNVISNYFDN